MRAADPLTEVETFNNKMIIQLTTLGIVNVQPAWFHLVTW